ncbi:MAG: hypothetical protein IPO09_06980 [Anaeromyxobacter sp.]|nr:hypothetical protein [Anaeromyxobacter sp.]
MTEAHLQLVAATAALGVLAALGVAVSRHRRRRTEAKAYLKGVRSMISGDPDAAIEALSDAARLGTPQAKESYLALGALLRRTGDLARAIRLHRNMLAGQWPDPAERREVLRELAEDYRRSGMLAEALELLAPGAPLDRASAEAYREVLADQGAWREAAQVQLGLAGAGPDRLRAHLLAAAARAEVAGAVAGGGGPAALQDAQRAAAAAVEADPGCAAAHLAVAEAAAAAGQPEAALAALGRGLDATPRAAVLAWPVLAALADRAAALGPLTARAAATPDDAGLHMLLGRLLHRLERPAEALVALRTALDLDARGEVTLALRDLLREVEATPAEGAELAARHELLVLALGRRVHAVRCVRCGAEAPARAWRCRACGAFDGFP